LELELSKSGVETADNEGDNSDGEKEEVFSLSPSVVRGDDGRSWIAGDMIEGISSSDVLVEQMEETLLVSSSESSFMLKGEDANVDDE
jgi:hypothetical protein